MNEKKQKSLGTPGLLALIMLAVLMMPILQAQDGKDEKSAYMGVTFRILDAQEREALQVKFGVMVESVERKSPADQSGLEVDDLILTFNGEKVRRAFDLVEMVSEHKPGEKVTLEILRDKKPKTISLTLGRQEKEKSFAYSDDMPLPMPHRQLRAKAHKRAFLGVSIEQIDGDFAEYFSLPDKSGVLIRSVEKGSPAEKGGLKAGDVIVAVGEKVVNETDDVNKTLADKKVDETIDIAVLRHGKKMKLAVKLGERDASSFLELFGEDGPEPGRHGYFEFNDHDIAQEIKEKLKDVRTQIKDTTRRIHRAVRHIKI